MMKGVKSKKLNLIIFIVVFTVTTTMYISQYRMTYNDPSDRKELSVDAIFSD